MNLGQKVYFSLDLIGSEDKSQFYNQKFNFEVESSIFCGTCLQKIEKMAVLESEFALHLGRIHTWRARRNAFRAGSPPHKFQKPSRKVPQATLSGLFYAIGLEKIDRSPPVDFSGPICYKTGFALPGVGFGPFFRVNKTEDFSEKHVFLSFSCLFSMVSLFMRVQKNAFFTGSTKTQRGFLRNVV